METTNKEHPNKVVFFDGVCGLCNWSVDYLLKIDDQKKLLFSPLQGNTAKELLGESEAQNLDSLYFYRDQTLLVKSEAWFAILTEVRGALFYISYPFRALPFAITDRIYDFIAKYRYKIFGKRDTCRLPTPEEREQFLN